jgi:ubiquinol-cytochrome c reductase iron-sulfur subunit
MRRVFDWLAALFLTLFGFLRGGGAEIEEKERIVPEGEPDRPAETVVIVLLVAATLAAAAFIAIYATGGLPNTTQMLGGALGVSLGCIAAALIIIGRRLVVTEELEEDYPQAEHPEARDEVAQLVEESGSRFTRKRLLIAAGGAAATALGLAAITPAVSFGPVFSVDRFYETTWKRGRRLVDERGRPFMASDIEPSTFYTAFPEGQDMRNISSAIVVVRVDPATLQLPRGRSPARWAPGGILAFSKICTHAGCAISLYRKPTFPPVQPGPALVCPCHYSTFDPARGGKVLFGPAGRPLPQLPLMVDSAGFLRANGTYSEPVGPSWWGVRLRKAKPI